MAVAAVLAAETWKASYEKEESRMMSLHLRGLTFPLPGVSAMPGILSTNSFQTNHLFA